MTFSSLFMALALCLVAWFRSVSAIARQRPWQALLCLLCPALIAPLARRGQLDLSFEFVLLEAALICLLPSVFYFGVIAR